MYTKGDLNFGTTLDTKTENYDEVTGAYLDHSCDQWVIGGKEQIEEMIKDLQEILKEHYSNER